MNDRLILTTEDANDWADRVIAQTMGGNGLSLRFLIATALQEAHRRGFSRALDGIEQRMAAPESSAR